MSLKRKLTITILAICCVFATLFGVVFSGTFSKHQVKAETVDNVFSGKTFTPTVEAANLVYSDNNQNRGYMGYTRLTDGVNDSTNDLGRFATKTNLNSIVDAVIDLDGVYLLNTLKIYAYDPGSTDSNFIPDRSGADLTIQTFYNGVWTNVIVCETSSEMTQYLINNATSAQNDAYYKFEFKSIRAERVRIHVSTPQTTNGVTFQEIECEGAKESNFVSFSNDILTNKTVNTTVNINGENVTYEPYDNNNGYKNLVDGVSTTEVGGRFSSKNTGGVSASIDLDGTYRLGIIKFKLYKDSVDANYIVKAGSTITVRAVYKGQTTTCIEIDNANLSNYLVGEDVLAFNLNDAMAEKLEIYVPEGSQYTTWYEVDCSGYQLNLNNKTSNILVGKNFVPTNEAAGYLWSDAYGYDKLTDGSLDKDTGRFSTNKNANALVDANVDLGNVYRLDYIIIQLYCEDNKADLEFLGSKIEIYTSYHNNETVMVDLSNPSSNPENAIIYQHKMGNGISDYYLLFSLNGLLADNIRIHIPSLNNNLVTISIREIECFASYDGTDKNTVTWVDGGNTYATTYIAQGSSVVLPSNPTKVGYNFVGWYTASSEGTLITGNTTITEDATFYASWQIIQYTINFTTSDKENSGLWFYENAETNNITNTIKGDFSIIVDYGTPIYRPEHGTFIIGHSEVPGGKDIDEKIVSVGLSNQAKEVMYRWRRWEENNSIYEKNEDIIYSNRTINAIYEKQYYTTIAVNNDNYGSLSLNNIVYKDDSNNACFWVAENATVSIQDNVLTISGVSTDGYNISTTYAIITANKTDQTGYTTTFSEWTNIGNKITGVTSIIANFTRNGNTYIVSFDSNGGGDFSSKSVIFGDSYGDLPTPEKASFKFLGWYTANVQGTKVNSSTLVATAENHTLYAMWATNVFTITWKNEDGSTILSENFESGTIPSYTGSTPTKAPTLEYAYSFVGWSTSLNGEAVSLPTVTNDASFFAVFKQVSVALYSLTVKETIGVNFYLDVAKYTSDINAYVELEYNHNAINYIPNIQTDRIYLYSATQSDGMYKFSLSFASGQIADEINIRLYSSSDELLFNKLNLSILTYCDAVIKSNQDAKLVKLCKSIIDYGKYSKEYFEYAPEVEIDKTDLVLPQSIKQEHLLQGLTQNEITSEEELVANVEVENLKFVRYSFVALSDVSIRIYFNILNGGTIDDYNITFTKPVGVLTDMDIKTGSNNWGYYVEIYGIESVNINKMFSVTITHKKGTSTTITYSALNYIATVIQKIGNSQGEKQLQQKNMCLAIYQYNLCAIDYFKIGNAWEVL